ncbi:MAG: hypothetical protein IJ637_07035, partial [Prevotella sp.]|nr:hypothetical protein [Prevotella sp.]
KNQLFSAENKISGAEKNFSAPEIFAISYKQKLTWYIMNGTWETQRHKDIATEVENFVSLCLCVQ